MTIREIIAYLWELAGEPSDKDPWAADAVDYNEETEMDTTSFGYRYYLRELNKAQNFLANYRTSRGRPIRFSKFFTRKNIKLGLETSSNSYSMQLIDDYTVRVEDPPTMDTDYYVDTKITLVFTDAADSTKTTEQDFLIVQAEQYDANHLDFTFMEEITPSSYQSNIYTAEFYFSAFKVNKDTGSGAGYSIVLPSYARNILSITDMSTGTKLDKAPSKDNLYNSNLTEGTPSQWFQSGETVYFDLYLTEPKWYTIRYQRVPLTLTVDSTELDIPIQWQDVIIMIAEMNQAKVAQENERATILRSQINSMISQLRTDLEEEWLDTETSGFYIRKE